ncbi:hypothetical protein Tco_1047585 [Tanacetum coccineum]
MSHAYYNKVKTKPFQARRNPYQPYKICNFVGRAKNVHVFVGCFVYVMKFRILEDLGNIIDGRLGEVVLGKTFVNASKITYDESLGLIRFAHRDDEVVFRMSQRTKELDLVSPLKKDKFEAFFVESLKVRKKWHDGTSRRNIGSNSNTNGLAVIDLTLTKNDLLMRKSNRWKRSTMEVDIIKKTENQAKMTKLSMEWKRLCKIKVKVNTEESAVKPEPELKNTIECNLNPSDGPGKPNSITMKTVKTLKAQS